MDERHGGLVAGVGIAATLEHAGIAALEAEREDVESYIGTCLIDHADNAEGHADTTQPQAVGQCLLLGDMA